MIPCNYTLFLFIFCVVGVLSCNEQQERLSWISKEERLLGSSSHNYWEGWRTTLARKAGNQVGRSQWVNLGHSSEWCCTGQLMQMLMRFTDLHWSHGVHGRASDGCCASLLTRGTAQIFQTCIIPAKVKEPGGTLAVPSPAHKPIPSF